MAYILDYHLEVVLQHRWKLYLDNAAAFAELFPGVATDVLTAWRTEAAALKPAIVPQFKRGVDTFPLIWVHAEGEDPFEQPLGDTYGRDAQGRKRTMVLATQTATISVFARNPDMLRVWYGIVRAILHTMLPKLLRYYLDLRFISADDMTTDEEEIAEQYGLAGATARHLRIEAKVQEQYTHWADTPNPKSWYVLAADQQTVDGNPGGVVPSGS